MFLHFRTHGQTSEAAHLDERVQLLITTNSKLQMARRNTLDLYIDSARCIQLEPLNAEIIAVGPIFTFKSLEALPASSSTSAVRYSKCKQCRLTAVSAEFDRALGRVGTQMVVQYMLTEDGRRVYC